jgi:hypothetical protein
VKPESVSLTDYAANKQEMTEVIGAIGSFFQQMTPIAAQAPGALPYLLEILQSYVAKLRGGDEIEGTLDQMIAEVRKRVEAAQNAPPQPPPPDPKAQAAVETAKLKVQGELAKTQATAQARHAEIAHETQAAITERAADAQFNIAEEEHKQQAQGRHAVEKLLPARPQP